MKQVGERKHPSGELKSIFLHLPTIICRTISRSRSLYMSLKKYQCHTEMEKHFSGGLGFDLRQ